MVDRGPSDLSQARMVLRRWLEDDDVLTHLAAIAFLRQHLCRPSIAS